MDVEQHEERFSPHSFVSDVDCYREEGVVRCRVEVQSANAVTEMFRKVLTDDDRIIDSDVVEGVVLLEPGPVDDSGNHADS